MPKPDNFVATTKDATVETTLSHGDDFELILENDTDLELITDIEEEEDITESWRVLIVDDDQEIHAMTKVALRGFKFEGKSLNLISAYSAKEAKGAIKSYPDTALILLDVVMEERDSGLQFVRYVREKLNNHLVRIVLRTGQPGEAPEESVIVNYTINDYKTKTELTHRRLFTTVVAALRSYKDVTTIETHRQKLENQAKQLEQEIVERKRADRLKDEFLANTSHELRTPLNGIIGLAESVLDETVGPLNSEQSDNLSLIVSSGKRLAQLINDILDFSQLKHQALLLQSTAFDIHALTEVVVTLIRPLLGKKPIQLLNYIPQNLPPVYADQNRVQQILFNLIGNAIKFTEAGSVKILGKVSGEHVAITIADTGIGITPDKLDRIFEPFEQADGSISRIYGGTGIGLTITKQLVELHHGQINVKSTLNKGTTITFTLPTSHQPVSDNLLDIKEANKESYLNLLISDTDTLSDTVTVTTTGGDFTILIVDDEPINQQVLKNHLSATYDIVCVSNGLDALDYLEHGHKFDLVILDVMLPRMSGYEVCKAIRLKYSPMELPIIMLTAKNRLTDMVTGFETGANDYLMKPFSKVELLIRIKTHLQLTDLRQLNASKDKFLSILAHDLRTPFISLLGNTELMLLNLGKLDYKDLKKMSNNIHLAAKATYNLLENLLTWSSIEQGRMKYEPKAINLKVLAQNTLDLLRETAQQKNIELIEMIPHDLWVYADQYMLDAVIRNLTSNALKFTPSEGNVTISVTFLTSKDDGKDIVEVAVSDTGIGISQENIDKLFQFNTYHTTLGTAHEKGTGLGLIICKEMIETNQGEIKIESQLSQGTMIKFTLPCASDLSSVDMLEWGSVPTVVSHIQNQPKTDIEDSSTFAVPPENRLQILLDLALQGDVKAIQEEASILQKTNKNLLPFTQKLEQFAQNFDIDEILAMINKYLTQ